MTGNWCKGLLFAGAALLASTALAAAGTVRVTVAEYSAKTGPYFEKAASAFEAANPDTDVQIEVVPWDVLQQKLTTDISGNANADIAIIGTRWLIDFVEQGIAEPLDGYMNDEFKARFIETFMSPSVNGRQNLWPADRGLRSRHVLQQGPVRESRHYRAPGDLGRAEGGRREDQGARR
jgi:ABC-type glycerol-3-phosphate transport system substrate-binding protein